MNHNLVPFAPSATSRQFHDAPVDAVNDAYSGLLEHSGDLIDVAMHTTDPQQAAVIIHLAQAMAERLGVVKYLALTRLQKLKEGH